MAEISRYLRQIQLAGRGEEVRDALVGGLNVMNNSIRPAVEETVTEVLSNGDYTGPKGERGPNEVNSTTATSLTGILCGNGSTVEAVQLDTEPVAESQNPITSGAVAAALENFHPVDTPDWNQNNSAKPDYIKNRPFYSEINYGYTIANGNISRLMTNAPYITVDGTLYYWINSVGSPIYNGSSEPLILLQNKKFSVTVSRGTISSSLKDCYPETISTMEYYPSSGVSYNIVGSAIRCGEAVLIEVINPKSTPSNQPTASQHLVQLFAAWNTAYYVELKRESGELITQVPGKYLDLSSRAPAFQSTEYTSGDYLQESFYLLAADSSRYYRTTIQGLIEQTVLYHLFYGFDTNGKTVFNAINELYDRLSSSLNSINTKLTKLQRTQTSQSNTLREQQETILQMEERIRSLEDRVLRLEAGNVSEDGTQVTVSGGVLDLSGENVSAEEGVLVINSDAITVTAGVLTIGKANTVVVDGALDLPGTVSDGVLVITDPSIRIEEGVFTSGLAAADVKNGAFSADGTVDEGVLSISGSVTDGVLTM